MTFVHLHVHSEYSFLDGACRLTDLVAKAKRDAQAFEEMILFQEQVMQIVHRISYRTAFLKANYPLEYFAAAGGREWGNGSS